MQQLEWIQRNTLKWFGHVERIGSKEFVKKVYESELEGPNRGGRPLGRWGDRVEEYLRERGMNEGKCLKKQGGSVWIGRGEDTSAVATQRE